MHKMVCLAFKIAPAKKKKKKKKKNELKKKKKKKKERKYERPENDERAVEDNQMIFWGALLH